MMKEYYVVTMFCKNSQNMTEYHDVLLWEQYITCMKYVAKFPIQKIIIATALK